MTKNYFIRSNLINKNASGFTLIELLIAASLSIVLMLIATYGLSVIVQANQKGEAKSLTRNNLNRALEFISDEVKTAKSVKDDTPPAPFWAWTQLSGSSPQPELYLEIPLSVASIDDINYTIQVKNHEFYNGSAVTLSGNPTTLGALGLANNKVYYVTGANQNEFKITNTSGGSIIPLNSSLATELTVNKLVIYYLQDSTNTWLKPKSISRSTGPCTGSGNPNCSILVDSVSRIGKDTPATTDGFDANVSNSRKVTVNITGQLTDDNPPLPDDLEKVSAEVFARSDTPTP